MPALKFAAHVSVRNVYVSVFNCNQSLDQHLVRAGEKYLFPTHITLILVDGNGLPKLEPTLFILF